MKILFVCLGNICRSPLAEGILRDKINKAGLQDKVTVDSVGFEPFHQGDSPDNRAIRVAREHGIDIKDHRARLFTVEDFDQSDLIYVMDRNNYSDVLAMVRDQEDINKVDYIMNVLRPGSDAAVPDPWYGYQQDFERTYQLLDTATTALLDDLKESIS